MDPFPYEFNLFLLFKSGEALGNYQVTIQPIRPNTGDKVSPANYTVNFESPGDRGVGICSTMIVEFDVHGLWWFDIYLTELGGQKNSRRITRVPLRVVYLPQQMQTRALS